MTKAVIFDVDGTLVDSMALHWLSYCEATGKGLDKMRVYALEGKRAAEIIHEITGWKGAKLAKAVKKKEEAYTKLSKDLKPRPEAITLIGRLRGKGLKIGMATGTARANVKRIFGKSTSLFDAIVAAEDYKKAKPSSEPYLRAAKELGLKPGECVVVENAVLGVESAKAAGMRCVAVTYTMPKEMLKKADAVAKKIEEVSKWI